MSCGKHHDTPCAQVIEALYLYIDGELDESSHALVRDHLEECAPCLKEFGIEQEVKALVKRCCCQAPPAPDQLRARLTLKLASVNITENP